MADSPSERRMSNSERIEKLKEASKTSSQALPAKDGILDLPEPKYREVAGHVRRRSERTVRAEPPPQAARISSTAQRPRPNRGNKQSNGFDGENGSDSDDDNPKGGHDGSDGPIARRWQVREPPIDSIEPTRASSSTSTSFTPEETARVNLHRALQKDSRVWQDILETYTKNRAAGPSEKKALIKGDARFPHSKRDAWGYEHPEIIRIYEQRLREYLDEALCYDIEEATEEGDLFNEQPNLLEEIIDRIELDLILEGGNRCPFSFIEEISESQYPKAKLIEVLRYYPGGIRSMDNPFRFRNLAKTYQTKALEGIHVRDESPLFKLLKLSLRDGQSTPEYIDWILSGIPGNVIDEAYQQRLRQLRGKKVRETFESLGQTRINQLFCANPSDGHINLVLFKGGHPVGLRHVSPQDLDGLGWYYDGTYQRRCRNELDEDGNVFRVAMSGQVLALVRGDTESFLPYNFVPPGPSHGDTTGNF